MLRRPLNVPPLQRRIDPTLMCSAAHREIGFEDPLLWCISEEQSEGVLGCWLLVFLMDTYLR